MTVEMLGKNAFVDKLIGELKAYCESRQVAASDSSEETIVSSLRVSVQTKAVKNQFSVAISLPIKQSVHIEWWTASTVKVASNFKICSLTRRSVNHALCLVGMLAVALEVLKEHICGEDYTSNDTLFKIVQHNCELTARVDQLLTTVTALTALTKDTQSQVSLLTGRLEVLEAMCACKGDDDNTHVEELALHTSVHTHSVSDSVSLASTCLSDSQEVPVHLEGVDREGVDLIIQRGACVSSDHDDYNDVCDEARWALLDLLDTVELHDSHVSDECRRLITEWTQDSSVAFIDSVEDQLCQSRRVLQ
eukprot:gene27588-34332_t